MRSFQNLRLCPTSIKTIQKKYQIVSERYEIWRRIDFEEVKGFWHPESDVLFWFVMNPVVISIEGLQNATIINLLTAKIVFANEK